MLEWNKSDGEIGQFRMPYPSRFTVVDESVFDRPRSAQANRFQAPMRTRPPTPDVRQLSVVPGMTFNFQAERAEPGPVKISLNRRFIIYKGSLLDLIYVNPDAKARAFLEKARQAIYSGGGSAELRADTSFILNGVYLPSSAGFYRPLSGLSWNNNVYALGAPVQLVQGHRYMSRWLGELAPGVDCGDILSSVQQAISQVSAQPTWPWQNLVAYGPPLTPSGFPADMFSFPYATPGFCPIWVDGTWKAPTTPTVDSKQLPGIPGLFPTDLFDYTAQQRLMEAPQAPGPCNPADLAFDPVTGIFKCAGVAMPSIPLPRTPPITTPPIISPPTPPITTPPKKEEKKSVVPWVIGGGVVLIGGVILLAR